jgi:hypothetical protein
VQAFDHAWHSSVLAQIRVRDNRYAAYSGAALDEIAEDFRRHDVEHLAANRARVRRAVAERLRDAQDQHPLQARVIRKQAALRRLLDQASDVLFAIKPCWAMSPLVVSQVLPASRLFDVVIFDEASQVTPADAISSIMRAHQVIVAGDDRQLPPTSFFRQVDESDPDCCGLRRLVSEGCRRGWRRQGWVGHPCHGGGRTDPIRGGRSTTPGRGWNHGCSQIRGRGIPSGLRGRPPVGARPDGHGNRSRRKVVPGIKQRQRPGSSSQGASGTSRLDLPTPLVDELVPRSRE